MVSIVKRERVCRDSTREDRRSMGSPSSPSTPREAIGLISSQLAQRSEGRPIRSALPQSPGL